MDTLDKVDKVPFIPFNKENSGVPRIFRGSTPWSDMPSALGLVLYFKGLSWGASVFDGNKLIYYSGDKWCFYLITLHLLQTHVLFTINVPYSLIFDLKEQLPFIWNYVSIIKSDL